MEEAEVAEVQKLASLGGPVLVEVVGKHLAGVTVDRRSCGGRVTARVGAPGQLFEHHDVDGQVGGGEQLDHVVA
jgi:hypothetical protein